METIVKALSMLSDKKKIVDPERLDTQGDENGDDSKVFDQLRKSIKNAKKKE